MKKEDLTQVKHIGASRMKSLNELGITTLKQLHETPMDKLAKISTIGAHYAKLIKAAVRESYKEKPEKKARETAPGQKDKIEEVKNDFIKRIEGLQKRLRRTNKNLKPPYNKSKLVSYTAFQKGSKALINRLHGLEKIQGDLSKKMSKNIMKRADALNAALKKVGTKLKKKKYQKLSKEIQSLSNMLKKTRS